MADAHKNFAYSTVATAPSPATSGTSLVVAAATGTLYPAVPFNAVICPAGTQPTTTNAEVVRVTNISTDTLTITRAQETSAARTVVVGDQIFAAVTAKSLTDIEGVVPAALGSGGDLLETTYGTPTAAWRKPPGYYMRPSGAIAETFERRYISTSLVPTTATIMMTAIELEAGMVVSNFNFKTGGTAGATLTNNWCALYDASRVQVASTADQGLASLGGNTIFTWPVTTIASGASSTYTVPTSALYYIGTMIKGTTMPNINSISASLVIGNAPILWGTSSTGQAGVNAFPFTAGALTSANNAAYYMWIT